MMTCAVQRFRAMPRLTRTCVQNYTVFRAAVVSAASRCVQAEAQPLTRLGAGLQHNNELDMVVGLALNSFDSSAP